MKKHSLIIFLLIISVFAVLLIPVITAEGETVATMADCGLESGVYTIKSIADDTYFNAFNLSYTAGGYAYTDKYSGEEGENILLLRQDDGSYLIYPQSETGKYAFCTESYDAGARIAKSATLSAQSYFEIRVTNGNYVILPKGKDTVLGVGDGKTLYRKRLVTLEKFSGADTQKWVIEPVPITAIELKTVSERINVNSVSAVYAVVSPAYMKNFVKWHSSDESIVMIDDDGSFCALSEGVATVTATVGGMSADIDVTVVRSDAYTWYSQHLATGGGWHGGELSSVYFYSGAYKRFIISGYNRGLDWMDEGCAITSVAMVLHNLGARYDKGYDFRFEADGSLECDPYTVALANTGNVGLTTSSGTLYYSPILMNLNVITSNFSLYGRKITYTETSGVTKQKIKEALDGHPEGIIVRMQNSYNGSHYLVIAKCVNPTASNPSDYRFMVYDSASQERIDGDNVQFEQSVSYLDLRYRYSNMISIITFGIAEE